MHMIGQLTNRWNSLIISQQGVVIPFQYFRSTICIYILLNDNKSISTRLEQRKKGMPKMSHNTFTLSDS